MPSTTSGSRTSLRQLYPGRIDLVILIAVSAVFLVVGLNLPVLTVRKFWERNTFSILSGITNLWHERYYFLSVIVFFFSIVFPIVKLATLFVIWVARLKDEHRARLLSCLELIGKWSMLDVFVIAIIIVSVKLGALASARAEKGIYYFAVSILLAMLVTHLENRLARRAKRP